MVVPMLFLLLFAGISFAEEPFLQLEPLYQGDKPLFPGQRAWIGYRLRYNSSIDLTEEILPLLQAEGFKKIGEKEVRTKEEQGVTTRQILQRIEAVAPGKFSFPPSRVAGYGYKEEGGRKVFLNAELRGSTSEIVLEVAAFPEKDKLPSFNGAVGIFSIAASLENSSQMHQGDPLNVRLEISGKGDFETIHLPDLCCQPGFSGLFNFSDLPASKESSSNKNVFHLQLQPKNRLVTELPPIYFTSFDPLTKSYKTVSTEPLALKVESPLPVLEDIPAETKEQLYIERGLFFTPSRLGDLSLLIAWFSEMNKLFLFFPIVCAWMAYNFRKERKRPQSSIYLEESLKMQDREASFVLLEEALKSAILEGRITESAGSNHLLQKLQERRYSIVKSYSYQEALKELKALWPGL